MDRGYVPPVRKADKSIEDLNPGHPKLLQLMQGVRTKYPFLQPSVVPGDESLVGWALRGCNEHWLELVVYMTLPLVNRTAYTQSDAKSLNEFLSRLPPSEQDRIISHVSWTFKSGLTEFASTSCVAVPSDVFPIVDARMKAIAVPDNEMEVESDEWSDDEMEMDTDSVIQQRAVLLAQRRSMQAMYAKAHEQLREVRSEKREEDDDDMWSF